MKILKFTTSKGGFALIDGKEQIDQTLKALLDEYTPVAKVSEMSEDQFGEVVESSIHTGLFAHYVKEIPVNTYCYKSCLESFESLVRSLGWYLWHNPCQHPDNIEIQPASLGWYYEKERKYNESESKTLYNPILLKKI